MLTKKELYIRLCELEETIFNLEVRVDNLEDEVKKLTKKSKVTKKGKD